MDIGHWVFVFVGVPRHACYYKNKPNEECKEMETVMYNAQTPIV